MKKYISILILVIASVTTISAQIKNQQKMTASNTGISLVGSWTGTQTTDAGLYPQAFQFQLTDKGEFLMTTSTGTVAANGTYTYKDNRFTASFKQLSSGETFTIAGTYDGNTQKLNCTMGSGTNTTGQGRITLSRVGGQVITINNPNIPVKANSTIKAGGIKINQPVSGSTTNPTTPSTDPGSIIGGQFFSGADATYSNLYYLRTATVKIWTGADNKEKPSSMGLDLFVNSPSTYGFASDTSQQYLVSSSPWNPTRPYEIAANSQVTLTMDQMYFAWDERQKPNYHPEQISLTQFNKNGLTLYLSYSPNFFTDAWKVDKVELIVDFTRADGTHHPIYGNKSIIFNNIGLLSNAKQVAVLKTDRFLMPLN